jgi:hypothetical protein
MFGTDGDIAPAQRPVPFFSHDTDEQFLAMQPFNRIRRKKDHAHGIVARAGKLKPKIDTADIPQQCIGHLSKDPRAVPG